MKNQMRMIKQAALGSLCALAVVSASTAEEVPERILTSPSLDDTSKFSFIAFGDTPNTDFDPSKKPCYDRSGITPCNTETFPPAPPKMDNCKKYSDEKMHSLKVKYNEYRALVLKQMAASLQGEHAPAATPTTFAVATGDLVWRGRDDDSWKTFTGIFGDIISQCPPRLFSVMGNRELCDYRGDVDAMENFFSAFPCQVQNGKGLHYFAFFAGNSVFINLGSGGLGPWADWDTTMMYDASWNCVDGSFEQQMAWLEIVIDYGVAEKGTKHVFVQYHKPSFTNLKHPPLATCNDPVSRLEQIKANKHFSLNYFVFNSHNHTTEVYRTDSGIMAMVVGSGGGPQRNLYCNVIHEKPTPKERFWKALGIPLNQRGARVNYFQVVVDGDNVTIQEVCLADNKDGGQSFELGVTIDKNGKVTPPVEKDACKLDPFK